jgi:hypothetical protein
VNTPIGLASASDEVTECVRHLLGVGGCR